MNKFTVAALYKFVSLENFTELKEPLEQFCKDNLVKGTLLLAHEGINGTIAGPRKGIDAVLAYLKKDPRLADLEHKESLASEMPFLRMKVRLKKEIVTLGVPSTDPNKAVGHYLNPQEWNELISDPDVILIDTRNDYEVSIGSFKNAIDPKTKSFREFPAYVQKELADKKDKKIAMYCTGGIRCEKSTSYMLDQGYENVYHLKGGILKYLEEVPEEQSLWKGECFVFDERVAVKHNLEEGSYDMCFGCRQPLSQEELLSDKYLKGIHCDYCYDSLTDDQKTRFAQRQKQIDLAKARNEKHLGQNVQQV